jgi:hypothetical protein
LASRRLTVVTPAYFTSVKPIEKLIHACSKLDLQFYMYGFAEPWPWLRWAKVTALRYELQKIKSEYVLVTDGSDALITGDEDEIFDRYNQFRGRVVVSAEKNCWPQEEIAPYFPNLDLSSPWRYINSGGYMGKTVDVIRLLTLMDSRRDLKCPEIGVYRTRDWDNDQFLMSLAYIQDPRNIVIDSKCVLFQTMGNTTEKEVTFDGNTVVNLVTNSEPVVIHFNGHAKGLEGFYNRRFEKRELTIA